MLRPNGARLLVKRVEEKKPESELIIVPETISQKPSAFAVVYAIGTLKQGGVSVGDLVVLRDYVGAPAEVFLPGDETPTECIIVNEDEVLAVVEGV